VSKKFPHQICTLIYPLMPQAQTLAQKTENTRKQIMLIEAFSFAMRGFCRFRQTDMLTGFVCALRRLAVMLRPRN
jgi:hypothetical protein